MEPLWYTKNTERVNFHMEYLAKFHFKLFFSKERWLEDTFTSCIAFNSQEIVENTQMKWMKINNNQNATNLHFPSTRKTINFFAYLGIINTFSFFLKQVFSNMPSVVFIYNVWTSQSFKNHCSCLATSIDFCHPICRIHKCGISN